IDGIQCTFVVEGNTYRVHSPLIGRFNAENLLGVFSLLCALGHPPADAVALLERIGSPSGRMERFSYGDAKIFVDYAHAPDALRNALSTLKEVTEGRLWVLFGSGGGKDPRRRAGMGAVAKELADAVVLTADNPRKEDPQKIVEDILASGVQVQFVELDRAKAIEKAIRAMGERDVMLVAGKGQEDFQIIGDKTFYLSDQAEVQRVIDELQAR
ncbi:MAG: hypothetical protein KDD70_15910, partial [Bdellovibrionales bacterium]|nr:hypothetical protein [Bdellovibrionales bacterium]